MKNVSQKIVLSKAVIFPTQSRKQFSKLTLDKNKNISTEYY